MQGLPLPSVMPWAGWCWQHGRALSVIAVAAPAWQLGEWTYGRWVPVHLNVQLYGWTSLPLVAWLLSLYEVDRSRVAAWGPAAVWAWSAALAIGSWQWLSGVTSGKIFLDWKGGGLMGPDGGDDVSVVRADGGLAGARARPGSYRANAGPC